MLCVKKTWINSYVSPNGLSFLRMLLTVIERVVLQTFPIKICKVLQWNNLLQN